MVPSKKARAIALCAAALSFFGTLALFARADEPTPTAPREFVVVATKPECVDYHVGQRVNLPADTPRELVKLDRGGANDEIYVIPIEVAEGQ